jgi:hypothetical protein
VVTTAGDRNHIGCFADQVKLTRALVRDLDEAVKEVKLLGEHEEQSSQKITELEALCKRSREDVEKLREEKTALEGMIQSRDELIMEMAEEYKLNRMGENDDDEDEYHDDEGNTITPLLPFFWVFFISSILILQMANTRNRVAANNAENNGENNNQDANLPPPPLLTLEQVLAMQPQMLQMMR